MARKGRDKSTRLALDTWVRLLECRNLVRGAVRRRIGGRFGLTPPQFDILVALVRMDGQAATFVELSRRLMVTSGNLTGIVDRLEQQRLVRREPSQSDRRVVRIRLTGKGTRTSRDVVRHHGRDLAGLFGALSQAELRTLKSLLGRVCDGMRARGRARSDM